MHSDGEGSKDEGDMEIKIFNAKWWVENSFVTIGFGGEKNVILTVDMNNKNLSSAAVRCL